MTDMKEKNEKAQIFIDGGNFFHLALKKLGIGENNFSLLSYCGFNIIH